VIWHTQTEEQVLARWASTRDGLRAAVAAERLARYGHNVLTAVKRRSPLAMFMEQLASPPVALLGLSAAVSVATGGLADAAVILGVVAINAVIGYVTESQAEKTINALGDIGPKQAVVLRDERPCTIGLDEVVPGDLLVLAPGTYIAADARLLASNQLSVDESALTGESLPVAKHHQFRGVEETPLGDRKNMIHMGTVVTGGSGLAVVVATGKHTEIGLIQSLVGEVKTPDTPLQRQLDDMGMQLAMVSGGICVVVFGLGVLRGAPWLLMMKSAISLAVAAVPEGLPTVATSTLALGIREMKRQNVLIRQLPAVESLGSVQTLCFDKTGTLTENRMRVVTIETPERMITVSVDGRFESLGRPMALSDAEDLQRLVDVTALNSEVALNGGALNPELDGSPTETALLEIALHAGEDVKGLRARHPLVKTVHRADGRPYMVTVHDTGGTEHLIAVKGSPYHVLERCDRCFGVSGLVALDETRRAAILQQNEAMASQALRVLGIAYGYSADTSTSAVTENLIWLGLIGMEDTIRPGMAELIAQFHEAGIETVMITGDQSATAFSFGQRLGLSHDKPLEIVDSTHLEKLDPGVLKSIVRDTTVFARVSPAHKLRIVQALQEGGRVIAMTGDGINDGPALKAADVGVALGEKGSDVARSVADVVLEDDNLHTMIIAVQQGRTIYRNIRKSLQYLIGGNLAEIEIMLVTTAIGAGEALNPMQLLWINLVTDILPAIGLALEPPESDVLKDKPRDPREKILRRADMWRLLRESLIVSAGSLGVYGYSLARYGIGPNTSTNTFMTLVTSQMFHAISCRSERTTVLDMNRTGNTVLLAGVAGSLALQIMAGILPPLRTLLRLSPIGPADWAAIAAGSIVPFLANESLKVLAHPISERETRS
ncbi:MAG: cation-translocating P-type ATPase, partial [Methylotetracoccus sp.]|nr:cation-translocating P-type ATPase [Methylotetracoccus sp.]